MPPAARRGGGASGSDLQATIGLRLGARHETNLLPARRRRRTPAGRDRRPAAGPGDARGMGKPFPGLREGGSDPVRVGFVGQPDPLRCLRDLEQTRFLIPVPGRRVVVPRGESPGAQGALQNRGAGSWERRRPRLAWRKSATAVAPAAALRARSSVSAARTRRRVPSSSVRRPPRDNRPASWSPSLCRCRPSSSFRTCSDRAYPSRSASDALARARWSRAKWGIGSRPPYHFQAARSSAAKPTPSRSTERQPSNLPASGSSASTNPPSAAR